MGVIYHHWLRFLIVRADARGAGTISLAPDRCKRFDDVKPFTQHLCKRFHVVEPLAAPRTAFSESRDDD